MIIFWAALAAILAFVAAFCFRSLPEKWLCDYGEAPSKAHSTYNRRLPMPAMLAAAALNGIFAVFFVRLGNSSLTNLSFCVVGALLILIAISDLKYTIIPNEILIACFISGLPIAFMKGWQSPLYGVLIGGGLLFFVVFIASKLLKADAMGMGDILLSGLCGVLCGAAGYIAVFLTALICAGLVFSALIIFKRIEKKSSQPFGPFLVLGVFSALCFQIEWQALFYWYLGI